MKANTRSALTPLDLCTLIAHETVSLLNADAEHWIPLSGFGQGWMFTRRPANWVKRSYRS